MSEQAGWEMIVGFGCEGGGVTVLGKKRPDGTWELRYSSSQMLLDENDDEDWVEHTRSLTTLAEAFEGSRGFFGAMMPSEPVHLDFRREVEAIVEAMAPQPEEVGYGSWERRNRELWRRACEPPDGDQ